MNRLGNLLLMLAALWTPCAGAMVTATVDRNRITDADSLTLTLRATAGERIDETSLAPVQRDFEIVSTNTTSQLSIVNGRSERSTDLNAVLVPRRTGSLRIPPLSIAGQRTRAITVEVSEAPTGVDSSRDVFVEVEVDQPSVYVQSQLVHTFRIYEAIDLVDRGRSQLEIPDAIVEELDSTQFQRTIDGRPYRVIELRHAIFPQKSGSLTIPAMSFNGSRLLARRSFFDRNVETLRRRSKPITVEVKPIPAAFPDAPWIPAASLKLEESWSALPDELKVGDSVTRTITVVAEGIDGSQLPPLVIPAVDGLKAYPDQPKSENTRGPDGITGIGINSTALLLTQPGDFELPEIRVPWWDTREDRLRFARIQAHPLNIASTVVPGAEPVATATEAVTPLPASGASATVPQANPVSIWMWTTIAALMGWLVTTAWLLLRMQPRREKPAAAADDPGESRLFGEFARCCENNAAPEARAALVRWSQADSGSTRPPTLQQLKQRFDDTDIGLALDDLDGSLFGSRQDAWSGDRLLAGIGQWRKARKGAQGKQAPALPPLYPENSGTSGAASAGV